MARLIDADALKKAIMAEPWKNEPNAVRLTVDYINIIIDEQPTVDAAPVVHGRWEQVQRWATKAKYRCTVCGREIMSAVKVNIAKYPYCHCGAKMDLEVE